MIQLIEGQNCMEEFVRLVKEYTETIAQQDPEVSQTLANQHLEEELQDSCVKYGAPYGKMYVAFDNEVPVGCVALTRNNEQYCEIKRLYVRPECRGKGISRILAEKIIADARLLGYAYMRLDTFPFMVSAMKLYEKLGFEYIERYNDNPASNAVFMQLTL